MQQEQTRPINNSAKKNDFCLTKLKIRSRFCQFLLVFDTHLIYTQKTILSKRQAISKF